MVTNIVDCASEEVKVGDPVVVTFVPTNRDGVGIPVFRLA